MILVDEDRALADLRELATFGKAGRGVNRPAFSDADIAGREWLADRMRGCGLEAAVDRVGTVYGRAPAAKTTVLLGSHSDSVPMGGWLDGALGVIFALEVARSRQASHPSASVGVDVVSFSDEEGTFLACMGSRAFCGLLSPDDLASARSMPPGKACSTASRRSDWRNGSRRDSTQPGIGPTSRRISSKVRS